MVFMDLAYATSVYVLTHLLTQLLMVAVYKSRAS